MLTGWAPAHLQKEITHPLNKLCPKGTVKKKICTTICYSKINMYENSPSVLLGMFHCLWAVNK